MLHVKLKTEFLLKGMLILLCWVSLDFFTFANSGINEDSPPQEAFVLFYMASCSHCQRFDPILKRYAAQHGIPVLAYTLDGRTLPSFPNSVIPNADEIRHFFPKGNPVVPTLFLMDLTYHRIIPVLRGEASTAQLNRRLQRIHRMRADDVS